MATTDFCTTPTAGINFNRRTTTKEFGLGTVVHGTVNSSLKLLSMDALFTGM